MDLGGPWSVSFPFPQRIYNFSIDLGRINKITLFVYRLELVWLTMCSINTKVELEFLPVYIPTEEERTNPKIYAINVRNAMAK